MSKSVDIKRSTTNCHQDQINISKQLLTVHRISLYKGRKYEGGAPSLDILSIYMRGTWEQMWMNLNCRPLEVKNQSQTRSLKYRSHETWLSDAEDKMFWHSGHM
jgi:hypothetical protein